MLLKDNREQMIYNKNFSYQCKGLALEPKQAVLQETLVAAHALARLPTPKFVRKNQPSALIAELGLLCRMCKAELEFGNFRT